MADPSEVRVWLLDLLAGRTSREEAADWASQWLRDDAQAVEDPNVWEGIKRLAGADLQTGPGAYLHTEQDFHAWLDALEGVD